MQPLSAQTQQASKIYTSSESILMYRFYFKLTIDWAIVISVKNPNIVFITTLQS